MVEVKLILLQIDIISLINFIKQWYAFLRMCSINGLICLILICYYCLHLFLETLFSFTHQVLFLIQYNIILKITASKKRFLFLKWKSIIIFFFWEKISSLFFWTNLTPRALNCPSLPNMINWSQFNFVPLPPPQVCTPAQHTWEHVGETYITSLT